MKRILAALAISAGVLWLAPVARAQVSNATVVSSCGGESFSAGQNRAISQDTTGKTCVDATVSATATIAALAPTGQAALTAGIASSRVALGSAGPTALVTNNGTVTAYVNFGDATVTATTSSYPINAGQSIAFDVGSNTYLAGITGSSTAALSVTTGTGLPAIASAGSGGGGGGGAVYGPTAVGSAAANPPVLGLAGTTDHTGTGNVQVADVNTSGQIAIQAPPTLPLPSGAATSANQSTGNTSLSNIDSSTSRLISSAGPVTHGSTPVPTTALIAGGKYNATPPTFADGDTGSIQLNAAGAVKVDGSAATQPVSGTVTANAGTGTFTIAGAVTNAGTFAVQNTAATPAGSNIIGKVGIDQTTPGTTNGVQINAALPAGTNVIGHVIADTGSTTAVTQATAANLNATVVGTGTFATQASQSGTWNITNISGTVSLPTGAATAANQTATQGSTGSAVPSSARYIGANSSGNLTGVIQADSTAAINVSTATTTQLVALSSGKKIYVTHWDVVAAGADNITLEYGTGSNCGTGTTVLTGAYNFAANGGISAGSGLGPILVVPASNALCILTSAAVQASGVVSYTQF